MFYLTKQVALLSSTPSRPRSVNKEGRNHGLTQKKPKNTGLLGSLDGTLGTGSRYFQSSLTSADEAVRRTS
jgi:hypothetical protein